MRKRWYLHVHTWRLLNVFAIFNVHIPNKIFSKAVLVLQSDAVLSVLINTNQTYVECVVHLHDGLEPKIRCRVTLEKMCYCSMCICYLLSWGVSHTLVEKHGFIVSWTGCAFMYNNKSILNLCCITGFFIERLSGWDWLLSRALESFLSFR